MYNNLCFIQSKGYELVAIVIFVGMWMCVCVLLGKSHKLGSLAPPIVFIPW